MAVWQDAWWRQALRFVYHAVAGGCRWGELVQRHADAEVASETPWCDHVQHRQSWEFMELIFVDASLARRGPGSANALPQDILSLRVIRRNGELRRLLISQHELRTVW